MQAFLVCLLNLLFASAMHVTVVGRKGKFKTPVGFVILNILAALVMAFFGLFIKWVVGMVAME